MLDRGCTVFDFSSIPWDELPSEPPQSLCRINNSLGVSLHSCPSEWLPQLTRLAQSNPHILAITLSTIDDPNFDASELPATLAKNRHNWVTDTPIPEGEDAVFWLGFPSYSQAIGTAMSMSVPLNYSPPQPSVLIFRTARAGTFRVGLLHITLLEAARVTWRLHGTEEASTTDLKRSASEAELQYDSFTVEVRSPGIHQIDITFDFEGSDIVREPWVPNSFRLRRV